MATTRLKLGSPQSVRCCPVIACPLYWVRRAEGTLPTRCKVQVLAPSKTPALRIASWNIRTMCPGLSAGLQLMGYSRKTAIINKELARLNIDVACRQETRLADSGSLMERDYTFFWQGLSQDEPRQYDIGFAVRNSLIATTETPSGGSSRILAHRMKTSAGFANIISAYAPTLTSTTEAKDRLYEALQETLSGIPSSEGIYLLGDFNAHVGTH